jgi:hypothetical protein
MLLRLTMEKFWKLSRGVPFSSLANRSSKKLADVAHGQVFRTGGKCHDQLKLYVQ